MGGHDTATTRTEISNEINVQINNTTKNLSKVLDNKSKLNILLKNINKNILAIRTILKLTNTYPYNIFNRLMIWNITIRNCPWELLR